jgi:hypothetical protein
VEGEFGYQAKKKAGNFVLATSNITLARVVAAEFPKIIQTPSQSQPNTSAYSPETNKVQPGKVLFRRPGLQLNGRLGFGRIDMTKARLYHICIKF